MSTEWKLIRASEAAFVVVPRWPTIDKVVAAWLVMRAAGKRLPIITQANQRIADATWQKWSEGGAYVLDLATQKYQRQGDGSTTETVARAEGLTDPIASELIRLTSWNNNTGGLKSCTHAIAKLMRKAYELEGVRESEVISRVLDMLDAWAAAQDPQCAQRTLEIFLVATDCQTVLESLRCNADGEPVLEDKDLFEVFSVGQFALNLCKLGADMQAVAEQVGWWLNIERQVRQEWLKLPNLYDEAVRREFANGLAAVVRTNARDMASWMWKNAKNVAGGNFQLLVMRRDKSDPRKRNVAILAGGQRLDLRGLANVLYLLEGHSHYDGYWYHQLGDGQKSQANFLLNGTPERMVPATWLSDDQLVELIEILVFKTRTLNQIEAESLADSLIASQPINRPPIANLRVLLVAALQGGLPPNLVETLIANQAKANEA